MMELFPIIGDGLQKRSSVINIIQGSDYTLIANEPLLTAVHSFLSPSKNKRQQRGNNLLGLAESLTYTEHKTLMKQFNTNVAFIFPENVKDTLLFLLF